MKTKLAVLAVLAAACASLVLANTYNEGNCALKKNDAGGYDCADAGTNCVRTTIDGKIFPGTCQNVSGYGLPGNGDCWCGGV